MANDATSLDILIRTLADTHGTDEVAAALGRVKAAANTTAVSTKELGSSQDALTQYQKDSAIPVLEAQAEKTNDLEKESKRAAAGHMVHNFAARELNRELGILGHVLNSTLGKFALPIAGMVAGWRLWTQRVNELATAMAGVELPDLSGQTNTVGAAAAAWKEYADKVGGAEKKLSETDSQTAIRLKQLNALIERTKVLLEAEKQEELARATTPEQKEEIEARYGGKFAGLDKEKRDAELNIKRKQVDDLEKEVIELRNKSNALTPPDKKFDSVLQSVISTGDTAKKDLDEKQKQLNEVEKKLAFWEALPIGKPRVENLKEKQASLIEGIQNDASRVKLGELAAGRLERYQKQRTDKSGFDSEAAAKEGQRFGLMQDIGVQSAINDATDSTSSKVEKTNNQAAAYRALNQAVEESTKLHLKAASEIESKKTLEANLTLQAIKAIDARVKELNQVLANLRQK